MTKFERVLSLGAAMVACAAAVMMVPEFRCAAGLDPANSCAPSKDPLPSFPSADSRLALKFVPTQDPRIARISEIYKVIEARQPRSAVAEAPLHWAGADSTKLTVYRGPREIDKIRLRIYTGGERTSLLFYYAGRQLIFVHQVGQPIASTAGRREQRFYFDEGRMIRWLGPGREPISDRAAEFAANSDYLARLGTQLLSTAGG